MWDFMTKWPDKKLGFGLMRLPKQDDKIIIPEVCKLVDEFLAKGFTYFDTAYVYEGSEAAFCEAISKRHKRDSYTIASKMSGWMLTDSFTPQYMFEGQLERCGIEYFDYYLLHSLQNSRVDLYEKFKCWDYCGQQKKDGRIKYLGFSFHGGPELLDKILTEHPDVDFVQLQINYVDWDNDAILSGANYDVCRKHGKDIIVMEPVKGGMLASINPELLKKYQAINPNATAAEYALRFVGSLPGVKMILSGMSTMEQMNENLKIFSDFKPLSEQEQNAVKEVAKGILEADTVPCTSCRYCCDGCPRKINIPDIFKALNMLKLFGEHGRPHFYYNDLLFSGTGKAGDCIACGQCESACPQHIKIIDSLKEASSRLDVAQ